MARDRKPSPDVIRDRIVDTLEWIAFGSVVVFFVGLILYFAFR